MDEALVCPKRSQHLDSETHPYADVPLEKRPNYKEWQTSSGDTEIRVVNWFSLTKFVGAAHLYIDGEEVDRSTAMTVSPHTPLLTSGAVSVYFSGALSVKASILWNDEVLLRDELNLFDRIANKMMQ